MIKKRYLTLLTLPLIIHLCHLFLFHYDGTFHTNYYEHGFKEIYMKEVSGLDYSQLDPALSQPYHFLGQGKQMIALESDDGKYVLKLFNPTRPLQKHWYTQWKNWQRYSSLKWIRRESFQKNIRLDKLFTRHKIAFEHLRNETGLLFVHLHPDKRINHLVHVTDKQGKKHTLLLEKTPFVLQKKAILVPEYLRACNPVQRQEALAKLEKLFETRIAANITDRIQTMENNYGFAEGEPIQLDVGRIHQVSHLEPNEKERIMENLHAWITSQFPAAP